MSRSPDAPTANRPRASRARQRQRLIDACISALYVHGPSNTTVEKVVAIAGMSPGIVRFYFESKAAMLVASLEYLANEFDERLLMPIAALRATPVVALERLVDIYLGPEIATARKVSVWYSFWGEASSRQEYHDICGHRDARFEALVRDLIGRLVAGTDAFQLDADAIALGLIGALEILWQGFAFQTESTIDRAAARSRCMAYLRSVFPGQFAAVPEVGHSADLPRSAYASPTLLAVERATLFNPSWQFAGLEGELAAAADFLAVDGPGVRALVVRTATGLRAYHNACRHRPHALTERDRGHSPEGFRCPLHGLAYDLEGRPSPDTGDREPLAPAEVTAHGGLVFVRGMAESGATLPAAIATWGTQGLPIDRAFPLIECEVEADWKLVAEAWLDTPTARRDDPASAHAELGAPAGGQGWTDARRATLQRNAPDRRRVFIAPNQLLTRDGDYLGVATLLPTTPGHCRLRLRGYALGASDARPRSYLAHRLARRELRAVAALAASVQQGLETPAPASVTSAAVPEPLGHFRHMIARLLPGTRRHPGDPT